MPLVTWSDKLSVGVKAIDEQHTVAQGHRESGTRVRLAPGPASVARLARMDGHRAYGAALAVGPLTSVLVQLADASRPVIEKILAHLGLHVQPPPKARSATCGT